MSKESYGILHSLFSPQTIGVVGASSKDGKMGNLFLKNLQSYYSGEIFIVHPTAKEILGIPAYSDIKDIPSNIDLLIPLIPANDVVKLIRNCAVGQVKVLLAIPSGFGEVPEGGKYLEEDLVNLARERHIRIIGPNSVGMLNCPLGLNASMIPEMPPGGPGFSCITQSGGYGMAVYMYTNDHQLQMAKFCDLGNTADVKLHDFLDYFRQDKETKVVGVYLESFVDQQNFFAHAKILAEEKPVILTRLGRTLAGRRASFAHLGLLSDDSDIQLKVNGSRIIPAQTGLELLEIAKGLSWQPLPRGRRVGIITGAGGVGVELADLCLENGLDVPEFSSHLQNSLRPHLPYYASVKNPIDLTPIWREYPKLYPPLLQTLFATDEIDILLVTVIDVATTLEPLMYAITEEVARVNRVGTPAKPIYIYWASPHNMRENRQILQRAQIPCYLSTITAARVLAAIYRYAMHASLEKD